MPLSDAERKDLDRIQAKGWKATPAEVARERVLVDKIQAGLKPKEGDWGGVGQLIDIPESLNDPMGYERRRALPTSMNALSAEPSSLGVTEPPPFGIKPQGFTPLTKIPQQGRTDLARPSPTPAVGNVSGMTPGPATSTTPELSPEDVKANTGKDGKVNWWKLLTPILATGGAAAIGGALGGVRGAAAAAQTTSTNLEAQAQQERQEATVRREETRREQERVRQEKKETEREKRERESERRTEADRKRREENDAINAYERTGAILPGLTPERRAEIDQREARKLQQEQKKEGRKAPARAPITHDIKGNEIVEEWDPNIQKWKQVRKGRRPERKPVEKPEKPLTPAERKTEIDILTNEEKEISDAGEKFGAARTHTPEQKARLKEIAEKKAKLRSANPVIKALGKAATAGGGAPTGAELTAAAKKVVDSGVTNPATGRPWTQAEAEAHIFAEYQKKQGK